MNKITCHNSPIILDVGYEIDYNIKLLIFGDSGAKLELYWYGHKTNDIWKSIKCLFYFYLMINIIFFFNTMFNLWFLNKDATTFVFLETEQNKENGVIRETNIYKKENKKKKKKIIILNPMIFFFYYFLNLFLNYINDERVEN